MLETTLYDETFRFAWPRSIPRFSKGYISFWQTYKKSPEFDEVELNLKVFTESLTKVFLVFNTAEALITFSKRYKKALERSESNSNIVTTEQISQAQFDRLRYMLNRKVFDGIRDFLVEILPTIYQHDLEARNDPSRTRFLYLVLLRDYILRMQEEIDRCRAILQKNPIQESAFVTRQEIRELETDSNYLNVKLSESLVEIAQMSEQLNKYSNFKQAQQNALMGFLLAVYVPMAFTTSYFGMNVTEINGGSWPLGEFWKAAIPLTVATIVLPALGFTILHNFPSQSRWRAIRRHSASISIGLGLFLFVFSIPARANPLAFTGYLFIAFGAALNLVRIFRRRNRSVLRFACWTLILLATIPCMVLSLRDQLVLMYSITSVVIFVVHFIVMVNLMYKRRPENNRTESS